MSRKNAWSLALSGKQRASALILVLMVLVFFALLTTFLLALAQNDVWRQDAYIESARWRASTEGAIAWSLDNLPDDLPNKDGLAFFSETLNNVHFTATLHRSSQSSPFPVELSVAMVDPDDDLTREVHLKGLAFHSPWRLETNRPARLYVKAPGPHIQWNQHPPERLVLASSENVSLSVAKVLFDLHCHAPETKIVQSLTVRKTAIFDGDLVLDGAITAQKIYVAGHLQFGEKGSITAENIILGMEADDDQRSHMKGQITVDHSAEAPLQYYINSSA